MIGVLAATAAMADATYSGSKPRSDKKQSPHEVEGSYRRDSRALQWAVLKNKRNSKGGELLRKTWEEPGLAIGIGSKRSYSFVAW